MANDAASSFSGMSQTVIAPGVGADRTRAPAVRDTASGTVITAEIPAVPAGPSYGVLLPDGSVWYPGSKKRLPAPLILRVVIWIVAFAVLLAGAGDFIIRYHPSLVSAIRHVVSSSPASPGGSNGGSRPSTTVTNGTSQTSQVNKVSPQPTGLAAGTTEYSVALPSYTILVSTSQRAFVTGTFMSNGQSGAAQPLTLPAGGSHSFDVPAGDEFSLFVAHVGVTIQVYFDLDRIATVPTPPNVFTILFVPAAKH